MTHIQELLNLQANLSNTGKVYTFYILATAETYQKAYGGTLVTNEILLDKAGNLSVQYNHN